MTHSLVTFGPETTIWDAIKKLVARRISAAPVVDADGRMIGMLSEFDCLNVLASDEFHADDHGRKIVADYMSKEFQTASPDSDIYALAQKFLSTPVRRFPIVEGERLVGQVSLSDVMRGIEEMRKKRSSLRRRYPDYREPS
jgi:CBS domain-containing protein